MAFSPDGQLLASGSLDGTIALWELGSGRQRPSLQGHRGSVEALAFSRTGDMLVSGGADGTARSWELATGKALVTLATGKALVTLGGLRDATSVLSVAFAPDGRVAVGSSDGTLRLWQPRGQEVQALDKHDVPVQAVAFSPDGQLLASAAMDTVRLFDAHSGVPLRALGDGYGGTSSISFSRDGGLLAFGSETGNLGVWESSGAVVAAFPSVDGAVGAVVFSPDGKVVLAASSDRKVHLLGHA